MKMLVKLAEFSSIPEAEVVRSKLEAFGVSATLEGEDASTVNVPLFPASGLIRLMVKEEDLEKAKEVLSGALD